MKETTEIQPQILIIDDDVTLCAGLRKLLRGRGYKVECIYDVILGYIGQVKGVTTLLF